MKFISLLIEDLRTKQQRSPLRKLQNTYSTGVHKFRAPRCHSNYVFYFGA